MLLSPLEDVTPGTILGAEVMDPASPDLTLLRPGAVLDAGMIAGLRRRGVSQVWIEDDLTRDLDAAVAPQLTAARLEVYARLRDDIKSLSRKTISVASSQAYRQAVMGLVTQAISSSAYASVTDAIFASDGPATHAANVAYLSILIGLRLESYVVSEQPRLDRIQARDMAVLGMAGMLHDVGKARLPATSQHLHECRPQLDEALVREYREHVILGRTLLADSRVPARVGYTVLHHHQRFDGSGWPDMAALSNGRAAGPLAGRAIHIFARVVAAANLLDNLLRTAEGARRPAVVALAEFASRQFDGWFDPLVRRAVLLSVPPFAVGEKVTLTGGCEAVVAAPNPADPCRPSVRLIADEHGRRPSSASCIDLSVNRELRITRAMGEDIGERLFELPPAVFPAGVDAYCAEAVLDDADDGGLSPSAEAA